MDRVVPVLKLDDPWARIAAAGVEIERCRLDLAELRRVRQYAIKELLATGFPVIKIAARLGTSRNAVYMLLKEKR